MWLHKKGPIWGEQIGWGWGSDLCAWTLISLSVKHFFFLSRRSLTCRGMRAGHRHPLYPCLHRNSRESQGGIFRFYYWLLGKFWFLWPTMGKKNSRVYGLSPEGRRNEGGEAGRQEQVRTCASESASDVTLGSRFCSLPCLLPPKVESCFKSGSV